MVTGDVSAAIDQGKGGGGRREVAGDSGNGSGEWRVNCYEANCYQAGTPWWREVQETTYLNSLTRDKYK